MTHGDILKNSYNTTAPHIFNGLFQGGIVSIFAYLNSAIFVNRKVFFRHYRVTVLAGRIEHIAIGYSICNRALTECTAVYSAAAYTIYFYILSKCTAIYIKATRGVTKLTSRPIQHAIFKRSVINIYLYTI